MRYHLTKVEEKKKAMRKSEPVMRKKLCSAWKLGGKCPRVS